MKSNRNTSCKFIVCNQALVGVQGNTDLEDLVCLYGSLVVRYFFHSLFVTMLWIEIIFNSSVFSSFSIYLEIRFAHIFCN